MGCSVIRDNSGNITKVTAPNGRESILFEELKKVIGDEENSLKVWAKAYTPTFKQSFGNWELLAEAKTLREDILKDTIYYEVFPNHEEGALFEASIQLHSSKSEGETATKIFGRRLAEIAEELFPNTKVGDTFTPKFGDKVDENGEPKIEYVNPIEYRQLVGSELRPADSATLGKIKEFLERIGVQVNEVQDITVNGARIGANGIAKILNGLIEIVKGKEDIALPEEAMHFAVALVEKQNPALFKQMFNKIGSYDIYQKTLQEYKDVYKNSEGNPDVPKIKKEAIARLLVQHIINKRGGNSESNVKTTAVREWWSKFLEWFKGLFSKAGFDPFERTVDKILKGKDDLQADTVNDSNYYQLDLPLITKLRDENTKVGKDTAGNYTRNGEKVKSVDYLVDHFYEEKRKGKYISEDEAQHAKREYKDATIGKGQMDIEDILHRYLDEQGKIREIVLPAPDRPNLMPGNKVFYNTLEINMKDRLNSYPGGTTFFNNINIYDEKSNTTGKVNLLAVMPDGKVDILQFKFPEINGKEGAIKNYEQTAYNIELEELRKILENGYGINRKDFRQLRTLPVRINYQNIQGQPGKIKMIGLKIGSVKVEAITDESLLPIPSQSEKTGNKELDNLIHKLRGLLEKIQDEKVPLAEADQKGVRVATLIAAIKKLQVQRDASKLIDNANIIVKRSESSYQDLLKRVEGADPSQMSIGEINNLSEAILDAKDNLLAYKDLDIIFERVYSPDDARAEKFIKDAGEIARRSARLIRNLEDLEDKTRTEIYAKKQNIKDELNPEKSLTWYRRMIRSLSQSSIKVGQELWALVKNINNKYQIQFSDRLKILEKNTEAVEKWAKENGGMKAVYHKIFSFDEKGRWKGKFISRTSPQFYKELQEAKKKKDLKWVKENIDTEGYIKWYASELLRRQENAKVLRLHAEDEQNEKMVQKSLKDFKDNYDISSFNAINDYNFVLNAYPKKDKWASKEYSELLKDENKPLFDLYNYWQDVLEKSHEAGLIASFERRTFFPNVRKEYLEKATQKPLAFAGTFIDDLSIQNEDTTFGKQDALTGEPIDNVHAAYVYDLGREAMDTDGNYFIDYSGKSMDLFRVMAIWERELIRFNLRTESESIAKLLASTESRKKALAVNKTGGLITDNGQPILIDNNTNTKYVKEMIDAIYYGKKLDNQQDVTFNIPYGKAAKAVNKLFGREVFDVPEQEYTKVSGIKALQTFNRYFVTKTLGANPLTALSQLFGGTVNSYLNAGKYFDKKDLLAAQAKMVSGRFYDKEGKIQAGLIDYFIPFMEDKTNEQSRKLSVNKAISFLSSEWLMYMQKSADKAVQVPIFLAFAENTTIRDGKLVNIRDLVKQEEGYADIYNLPYDQVQAKKAKIEKRINELKSKESLLKLSEIKNDELVLPGIDRHSQAVIDFRQKFLEFSKDALGNTSSEDLSLYKRSVMMQSFFMFKNWIPRMLDVRGQSLKYNPGTDSYEWGRVRMLYRGLQTNGLSLIGGMLKQLSGNEKDIIEVAKKIYKEKQQYFSSQGEDFNMSEADFIDAYVRGIASQMRELALTASLLGILLYARIHAPDHDDDPRVKGMYKWSLRAIDKLTDELSFFYDPTSFTNIANGSVFPAVSILTDAQKLLTNGIKDAYYWSTGNEEGMKSIKSTKYFLKSVPLVNQLVTYTAVFNNDFAKEMGIQITSQNGKR